MLTDPGRSTYQDEDDAFRAGVAAVVDRVGALDVSALPDGSVADAAGRAVLVVDGTHAWDPKYGARGNPATENRSNARLYAHLHAHLNAGGAQRRQQSATVQVLPVRSLTPVLAIVKLPQASDSTGAAVST